MNLFLLQNRRLWVQVLVPLPEKIPHGICEMHFVREIRLRRVKCLRAWVDLFHFTFCTSRKFHNSHCELFHIFP